MFIESENNRHITNQELMELRKKSKINLIDIRELYEYNICHIEGALLIPLGKLMRDHEQILQKNNTYYLYCHTGQRSYFMTDFLTKEGYDVVNVLGGIADNDEFNVPY